MSHKFNAKTTVCGQGHKHPSKAEAKRCDQLHLLQRGGVISGLICQPPFEFDIDGKPIKMLNGQNARFTPDFTYIENGVKVAEDVKGMMTQDARLRHALFRHLWPDIELRIIK